MVAATGCGQATMSLAEMSTPVMVGPVRRIGNGRASAERTVIGRVEGEVFDFASASETRRNLGGGMVEVERRTTAIAVDANVVANAIRTTAAGRSSRDAEVESIHAGAWFFISPGAAMQHRWIGLEGRVVEVADAK